MQHVEIFGFAGSTYVRTARMVCEEKRVDYQLQPLEFGEDSHRALHPFLRMPVMRVGGTLLYETLAIACYLDDAFEGPRLSPDAPLERARMLQWISTCNDYLYRDVVHGLLGDDTPDETRVANARRRLEIVDSQLRETPFLLGGEVYLCDLFLAPMVAFAQGQESGKPLFSGLTGLAAWRERLWSRASFAATQP